MAESKARESGKRRSTAGNFLSPVVGKHVALQRPEEDAAAEEQGAGGMAKQPGSRSATKESGPFSLTRPRMWKPLAKTSRHRPAEPVKTTPSGWTTSEPAFPRSQITGQPTPDFIDSLHSVVQRFCIFNNLSNKSEHVFCYMIADRESLITVAHLGFVSANAMASSSACSEFRARTLPAVYISPEVAATMAAAYVPGLSGYLATST
ncbi:uncharacterized protein LOC144159816 [Haemaphysalis longicornis]